MLAVILLKNNNALWLGYVYTRYTPMVYLRVKLFEVELQWDISRLTVVSREAKEEAASSAPTDSRLTRVSIVQEQEL